MKNPNKRLLKITIETLKQWPEGLNQYALFDILKYQGLSLRSTTYTRYLRLWRQAGHLRSYKVKNNVYYTIIKLYTKPEKKKNKSIIKKLLEWISQKN